MKTITYPIPLYFNYIGTMHHLLAKALASIKHPKIKVCINATPTPFPFTKCLNKILNEVKTPCFFFMHYDAEIIDQTIFDKIIDKYLTSNNNTASVTACDITDLLVLYDTQLIKQIGGWDEGFQNSYMELDLRKRIYSNNMQQLILYNNDCPSELLHNDASALRNPHKEGNITYIYDDTFQKDAARFYSIYTEEYTEDVKKALAKNIKFSIS